MSGLSGFILRGEVEHGTMVIDEALPGCSLAIVWIGEDDHILFEKVLDYLEVAEVEVHVQSDGVADMVRPKFLLFSSR